MPRINIPPLTRACLVACTCLSVLTAALKYRAWMSQQQEDDESASPDSQLYTVPYLTVVPSQSIVFPWTFVTATLVEQNIFTLVITLATVFYGGKYLERAWGSAEFAKFLLVVSLVPNVVTFAVYIVWFALSGNIMRSLTTICGGVALQAGLLVAFKQLVPEHTISIFKGIVKIRVKHFPVLFLLANTISGPLFGTDVAVVLAWLGFLSSWIYLRFYKRTFPDLGSNQAPSLKGDASETFALAYFFPDPLNRPVALISDAVFNVLIAIKVCTPFSAADISAGNSRAEARGDGSLNTIFNGVGSAGGRGAAPGSARAEAERRRAVALKALDQRLHAAPNRAAGGGDAGQGGSNVLGEMNLDTGEHRGADGSS